MKVQSSQYNERFFPNEEVIYRPEEFTGDMLVLYGGEDIGTCLYGEKAIFTSSYALSLRDQYEWTMLEKAVERNTPILAICRGAQLLNVFAGGSLFQHVDGHAGRNHPIRTSTGDSFVCNSLHHQMLRLPKEGAELLGWANVGGDRKTDKGSIVVDDPEPEIVYYPKINALAVQYHPEWMSERLDAVQYVKKLVKDKLNINPWSK
jgi:putative glutamine amidotransferase